MPTVQPLNLNSKIYTTFDEGNISISYKLNSIKVSFSKRKKVPASSYIIIEYLDFKKTVNVGVYTSVARIMPGIMNRNQMQVGVQEPGITSIGEAKKFCPYCGSVLNITGAKFCAGCGKAISV